VAVLAPESGKAATLDGQEVVHVGLADIAKWEDGPDGSLYVYGKATTPEVDTDDQIVSSEFSGKALQDWLDTAPALRVQHNAQRDPAGSGVRLELNRDGDGGHWVKGVVDEPTAVRLVKRGHLRAFSVGIAAPVIERDMTGKARGGIIKGGRIVEVSLVDSPANRSCFLEIAKAAGGDGHAEFSGKVYGADLLTKETRPKTVTVELPKNMSLSVKPSDLAKLATFKQRLVQDQNATKAAATQTVKAVTGEPEDPALAAVKTAEAGIYKRDIDTATRRRLAGEGRALPNLSYPIETHEDAHNAATLALSGHGDVSAAKKLIRRIASKEGWTDVLDRLKGGRKGKVSEPQAAKGKKGECPTCKGRGYVKSGNVKCEACSGSGKVKAADKAAEPQVTKCGTCDGGGMMDGKPCPDCKPGKKKAKKAAGIIPLPLGPSVDGRQYPVPAPLQKKKGKLRAICPGCGAKQNPEHAHCPECGGKLPARALQVHKNHDFVCLGCGKNLDKGEKHCPQCGKENPGYLPEADHKIPANKTAKSKPKKGKKGKPFGGSQAPPFGVKDKEDTDGDEPKKDKAAARVTKGSQSTGKKKKGKGGTPGSASGAEHAPEYTVPPHREPDGGAMEAFEADAGLSDGDGGDSQPLPAGVGHTDKAADPEMAAHMALKALNIPADMGALHALTCPAYDPADVAKAFPHASFADLDASAWQMADLEKAATAPLSEVAGLFSLGQAALNLKNADPYLLADLRQAAHKAFRDANPGPSSYPTPGELSPQRFSRPLINEGHEAPSPGHDAPHSFRIPATGGISAQDYTRSYLPGVASMSPQNAHTSPPVNPPATTGAPTGSPAGQYVTSAAHESAAHAISAMHDHLSHIFPDVCLMKPSDNDFRHPVPTPEGAPSVTPAPGTRKAAKKTAKARARKAAAAQRKTAKAQAAKRRKLERKVLKGKMTVNTARAKMGYEPLPDETVTKAATAPGEAPPAAAAFDPEALKAAVAPLVKRLKQQDKALTAQGKALKKVRKTADAIASQPDTSSAPFRGVALTKTTAPAVQAPSSAGYAEHAQLNQLRLLQQEAYNSPDPGARVAAMAELDRALGIAPMPANDTTPIPMRR
jgi:hypothetical protein